MKDQHEYENDLIEYLELLKEAKLLYQKTLSNEQMKGCVNRIVWKEISKYVYPKTWDLRYMNYDGFLGIVEGIVYYKSRA